MTSIGSILTPETFNLMTKRERFPFYHVSLARVYEGWVGVSIDLQFVLTFWLMGHERVASDQAPTGVEPAGV